MDLKELVLRIKGDPKGAVSALDSVQQATHKFGNIVKTVIAGAAVKAVYDFGKSCINAAGEAQQGEVLLRSSLGNVKGMTDAAKDSAVAWVNEMEASKSFDDAEISAALQRLSLIHISEPTRPY
jgi:phage tail tape-measure protein